MAGEKQKKELSNNMWATLLVLTICQIASNFSTGLAVNVTRSPRSARRMLTKLGASYNKPEQIHMAFGSTPSNIVIMWSSTSNEKSSVQFSSDPKNIKSINAQSTELKEYSENAVKFIHRAELKDLTPGKRYSYRVISGVSGSKSEMFSFNVPHNDLKQPQTFMVFADMGLITKSLHFIVHEAVSRKYETVFHIGDFAYNLHANKGKVGDGFMNKIQKFTSVVPYMTTPGDHERFFNYYHYRNRFSMPGASWPMKEEELWYSINIGLVHFISINTDGLLINDTNKDKQLAWLKKDLIKASKARKQTPWIIVMGHKPVYCTKSVMEQECQKEFSGLRESLEDLFFQYGVDLYISGHKHCYERSWPMYKSKVFQKSNVNPNAPIYLIIGALGYEYLVDGQLSRADWLAASMSDRKKELFGRLKIVNSTHLLWSVHAASNNEEVDNVQLIQLRHGSFGTPGPGALEVLKQKLTGSNNLPPEPFQIIDMPVKSTFYGISRKTMILATFFAIAFFLFIFLRHSKVRKVLRI